MARPSPVRRNEVIGLEVACGRDDQSVWKLQRGVPGSERGGCDSDLDVERLDLDRHPVDQTANGCDGGLTPA